MVSITIDNTNDSQLSPATLIQFDDFNVTTVPLPASVWLMLTGLVCMFGLSKRLLKCRDAKIHSIVLHHNKNQRQILAILSV